MANGSLRWDARGPVSSRYNPRRASLDGGWQNSVWKHERVDAGSRVWRYTNSADESGCLARRNCALCPQLLPGGWLLYLAENPKTEDSAIYAAPLSDLSKRVLVTRSPGPALYAPGGNGRDYLLTVSEQGLVAREFDIRKLTLGPPRTLVSQVRTSFPGLSPGGILLYPGGSKTGRFMWLDRAGKSLDV